LRPTGARLLVFPSGDDAMPGTRKTSVKAGIREMVKRIVKQFDPEKIILFGSHARGITW